jgi:hypothetical protein
MKAEHRAILVDALKRAKAAAEAVVSDDGGTCNFDTAVFAIKGVREKSIEEIGREAGVSISSSSWLGGRWFFVGGILRGQGNLRSRGADAAAKVLREVSSQIPGFHASCYQAMD